MWCACACGSPRRPENGIGSPATGVKQAIVNDQDVDPLEKQQMLLTTKSMLLISYRITVLMAILKIASARAGWQLPLIFWS